MGRFTAFAPVLAAALPLALPLASPACAASSPPPVPALTVDLSASSPSAAASAAPLDAAPPLPPDVTDAIDVTAPAPGCTIHARYWTGPVDLHVAADGAAFAGLTHAHDVRISLVEPAGAFLRASVGSEVIAGYVPLAQLELQPSRPVVLGGVFVPSAASRVALSGVRGDRVSVRVETPGGVELVGAPALPALAGEVACADLESDAAAFAAFDGSVAWGRAAGLREARFVAKHKVALSAGPGDPPVLRVTVDAPLASRAVTVIEQRAGRARVHWGSGNGDFFGWVDASELRPPPQGLKALREQAMHEAAQFGMIGLLPGTGPSAVTPAPPSTGRIACRTPVRIFAELAGRRYGIGEIAPGAPFLVDGRDGGAVAELVGPSSIVPSRGVRWLVAARDLAECAPSNTVEAADEDPDGTMVDLSASPAHAGAAGVTGNGSGFGLGSPPGTRLVTRPRVREGAVNVTGRLPPEIIARIVRQNFGRVRLCYEDGLRANPQLQGRVTTRFVIAPDGSVSSSQDAGSTLPAPAVVACIVRLFGKLSFPQPEGGAVQVVYPLELVPGQ
jgi:hypothetical protein